MRAAPPCAERPIHLAVASALIRDYVERARRGEVVARTLTPREAEVVKLVAEANTNEEIAQLLVISRKTSSAIARTCSRSWACATGCSSRAMRSDTG